MDKPSVPTKTPKFSRRTLIRGAATAAGSVAIASLWRLAYNIFTAPQKPEEVKVLRLKINQNLYQDAPKTNPVSSASPSIDTYIQFRGTVFKLYPQTAEKSEGPLILIRRANTINNPSFNIQGTGLEVRAADLFSILYHKPLNNLAQNEIHSFSAIVPTSPTIHQKTYLVPVPAGYNSLEAVLRAHPYRQ